METDTSYRATVHAIIREWNAFVNGSLVTTLLVAATAAIAVISAIIASSTKTAFSPWPTAIIVGVTLLWIVVSLPLAMLRAARNERVARVNGSNGSPHSKYAKELIDFYTEGSALKDLVANKKRASAVEMAQLDSEMNAFLARVNALITSRMGQNAATRFQDMSDNSTRYRAMNATPDEHWRQDRTYTMSLYLRNLQLIAQTRMYDQ
jgi:hypothetical protein